MDRAENELLTRTGPGTPCGELMRRYWQPVTLSEDLPPGGAPLALTLMGEEFVLFRDDAGRPGLLDIHCSHRGVDLSYGRVEDGGLRCIYHGWLYDIHGRCLDQPGERGGGKNKESIRHPAYPCIERAGAIFAYLGPGEPPLFPSYQFLTAPEDHTFAIRLFSECNYLQGNEGNIDLAHLSFLHHIRARGDRVFFEGELGSRGAAPERESYETELTEFSVRSYKIQEQAAPDHYHLYVTEFVLPNLTTFGGSGYEIGGYSVNWHVPIDDAHHWKYTFMYGTQEPIDREGLRKTRATMAPGNKPLLNKANRYQQDRNSMKTDSYSGLAANFQIQDLCVTEGMGPVIDRTKEHLTSMDVPMITSRKLLLKAIKDLEQGREPANVARDPEQNRFVLVTCDDLVPNSIPWKEYVKTSVTAKLSSNGGGMEGGAS